MHKHLTSDIIICTKNRPADLEKALDSILIQTHPAKKIIIVDASDSQLTQDLIDNFSNKFPLQQFEYLKSAISSTTHQRNYGIEKATGDITFFLDDDVILENDFIEEIEKVYQSHPNVGGVSGIDLNLKEHGMIYTLFKKLFFLPYISKKSQNRIRFSGFPVISLIPDKITPADFMEGNLCSYNRKTLDTFKFDEKLKKYAFMEDVDISYRVSRKFKLMKNPFARLRHYPSPANRLKKRELRAVYTFNHFYLFIKNIPKNPITVLAHFWSHVGLLIEGLLAAIINKNFSYITGMVSGYNRIIRYTLSGFKNFNIPQ
jgi:glycosyltransferase involved in cell wall biosynthesis